MDNKKVVFQRLKNKLIKMGFLYHTPKSYLNEQEKEDIRKNGIIHFTFSKNINNIIKNGLLPGKEYMSRKEKNLCWFYINYPDDFEKNLSIVRSKGIRVNVDCCIIIKNLSEEQLNNMLIRRNNDNAVVHRGVLKTNNMSVILLDAKQI